MSFSLYSENGRLGPIATISGWGELVDAVGHDNRYQALLELLEHGYTVRPEEVVKDVDLFLKRTATLAPEVREMLNDLNELLEQAKEIAIVAE